MVRTQRKVYHGKSRNRISSEEHRKNLRKTESNGNEKCYLAILIARKDITICKKGLCVDQWNRLVNVFFITFLPKNDKFSSLPRLHIRGKNFFAKIVRFWSLPRLTIRGTFILEKTKSGFF